MTSSRPRTIADMVAELLDQIEAENADRVDYRSAMPRETAEKAMNALAWMYGCRSGSTASVYAAVALADALRDYPIVTGKRDS